MVEDISDSNFKEKISKNKELVLVDFWADWCSPCKILGMILEDISKEEKNIKIYKINIDKNNKIRDKYKIMSIPTILFFKDGNVIDTTIGLLNKTQIKNRIKDIK